MEEGVFTILVGISSIVLAIVAISLSFLFSTRASKSQQETHTILLETQEQLAESRALLDEDRRRVEEENEIKRLRTSFTYRDIRFLIETYLNRLNEYFEIKYETFLNDPYEYDRVMSSTKNHFAKFFTLIHSNSTIIDPLFYTECLSLEINLDVLASTKEIYDFWFFKTWRDDLLRVNDKLITLYKSAVIEEELNK